MVDNVKEQQILKGVLDQRRIREALNHLIVRRSLPQTITEWSEFIACASINYEATEVVARSHNSIHRYIEKRFFKHRVEVREAISKARSRIHLCTDTWTSPHRKEFAGDQRPLRGRARPSSEGPYCTATGCGVSDTY